MFTIGRAESPEDLQAVRTLLEEYLACFRLDPQFQQCIATQNVERELATLPGFYAPPTGSLLLARDKGNAAGCVAFKPLASGICEMKRMFVRPAFRGQGLGRRLAEAIVAEAARAGYARMRLATMPSMPSAQALYRTLGFEDIAPYHLRPIPSVVYLEADLAQRPTSPPDGGVRCHRQA